MKRRGFLKTLLLAGGVGAAVKSLPGLSGGVERVPDGAYLLLKQYQDGLVPKSEIVAAWIASGRPYLGFYDSSILDAPYEPR